MKDAQHLCPDKTHDGLTDHQAIAAHECIPHIWRTAEERLDGQSENAYLAR